MTKQTTKLHFLGYLKLGGSLLRYTMSFKTNLIFLIVFTVVGFLGDILSRGTGWTGPYFLAIVALYVSQFLNAVCISSLAQTSPYKRALCVESPAALNAVISLGAFLALAGLRVLYARIYGGYTRMMLVGLFLFCLASLFCSVYDVLVFRIPALGYALLILVVVFLSTSGGFLFEFTPDAEVKGSLELLAGLSLFDRPGAAFLAGLGCILLDAVLFYALSAALYKRPLAERVYKQALARAK